MSVARNLRVTLDMIKWEHSIFALPFALAGAMLAAGGLPTWRQLGWILVAMVAARSAAMAFNRLADHSLDAANPRTRARALPAGLLSRQFVGGFVVLSCAVFVLAAAELNRLALMLSPVALAILLLYSYTKRFTRWSHLVLGVGLAIAPVGGYLAVAGRWSQPWWMLVALAIAVASWSGGFDILYALQDVEFDRAAALHSLPAAVGEWNAVRISRLLHTATIAGLIVAGVAIGAGWLYGAGVAAVAGLLCYEHTLIHPNDLSRINAAFFTMNGIISVLFFAFVAADRLAAAYLR